MTYSDLTELFLIGFHDTIRKMYKENKRKMRIVWEDCGMPKTLLVKYLKTGYPLMLSYRFFANIRKELENPENLHKKYMQQIIEKFESTMENEVTLYITTAMQNNVDDVSGWQIHLVVGNQLLKVIYEILKTYYMDK